MAASTLLSATIKFNGSQILQEQRDVTVNFVVNRTGLTIIYVETILSEPVQDRYEQLSVVGERSGETGVYWSKRGFRAPPNRK